MRVVAYATHSSVLYCLPLFQDHFITTDCGFVRFHNLFVPPLAAEWRQSCENYQ
jgi:hypothetical protein